MRFLSPAMILLAAALVVACLFSVPAQASADIQDQKMSIARDFVARMKKGFAKVDSKPAPQTPGNIQSEEIRSRGYAQDEELIFQVAAKLPSFFILKDIVTGRIHNDDIVFSLSDFVRAVEFVIDVDAAAGKASGWYMRENKTFKLDMATRKVTTDRGTYDMSPAVQVIDDVIYVSAQDISQWFGFEVTYELKILTLFVKSPVFLPAQEKQMRQKRVFTSSEIGPATLPLALNNDAKITDIPFADFGWASSFDKNGETNESDLSHEAYLTTAGDFLKGTLSTYTQANDTDNVSNVRVNYKMESLKPEFLGPIGARRVELGDLIAPKLPILPSAGSQIGARITNIDPRRVTDLSSTRITGEAPPGWDVELYRNQSLVSFQSVGQNGIYSFDDVRLFGTNNNLRVVLYGPQGEIRERDVSVPVDQKRLSSDETTYDLSLTLNDTQTYRKDTNSINVNKRDDKGDPEFVARFERPVGDNTAASLGFQTNVSQGKRDTFLQTGISTSIGGALLNANAAIDNYAELGSEFSLRRSFGEHDAGNTLGLFTDKFMTRGEDTDRVILDNQLYLTGPLPFSDLYGFNYNIGTGYSQTESGKSLLTFNTGYSGSYSRVGFGQQLSYRHDTATQDKEDLYNLQSSLTGSIGAYRLRFLADQELSPDPGFNTFLASAWRGLGEDLDGSLNLTRNQEDRETKGTVQLDWNAGAALISPSVGYNTEGDIEARLNVRAGIAYDRGLKFHDNFITSSGGLSVFVFLDKNGNNVFDGTDEPIPNAMVRSPQSNIFMPTNEKGIALLTRLLPLTLTDVYIDPETLQDPYWVPGYGGASVLPREGSLMEMQFPVHISGEIEGVVSIKENERTFFAGNAEVVLKPIDGINKQDISTTTESDGYYTIPRIPPGVYMLTIDHKSAKRAKAAPPPPRIIAIDYNGTILNQQNIVMTGAQTPIPVVVRRVQSGLKSGGTQYALKVREGGGDSLLGMVRRLSVKKAPGDVFDGLKKMDIRMDKEKDVVYYKLPSNDMAQTYDRCLMIADSGVSCDFIALVGPKKDASFKTAMAR
jgi:hypothetical protein